MILRLLNPQGIAGIAAAIVLAVLLVLARGETHHWKKQSGQFEQLYRAEQTAFAQTQANYRAAAEQARAADQANAERVAAAQRSINQRTKDAYEKRIADVRAVAERLRAGPAAAHSGGGDSTPMPSLSPSATADAEAAGEGRLPDADSLTATEQAIQLDELIKWVRAQAEVDNRGDAAAIRR
jgi:hypothetical protein